MLPQSVMGTIASSVMEADIALAILSCDIFASLIESLANPSNDIFSPDVMYIIDSLGVRLPIVHCEWSPLEHCSQQAASEAMHNPVLFAVQLPSTHFEWSPLGHISQEYESDCIETIGESDIAATAEEGDFDELLRAVILIPIPPPIAKTITATFFRVVFMFETLFLVGDLFADHIVRFDTSKTGSVIVLLLNLIRFL